MPTPSRESVKHCHFCGIAVNEKEYDYIGHQRVYSCGARDCEREIRDANRALVEEAAWDAQQDSYERYW